MCYRCLSTCPRGGLFRRIVQISEPCSALLSPRLLSPVGLMTSVGLPDPAVFRRVVRRLAGAKPPLRPPGPPEPAVPPPHQVRLLLRTVKPLVALVRQVGAVLADDAVPDALPPRRPTLLRQRKVVSLCGREGDPEEGNSVRSDGFALAHLVVIHRCQVVHELGKIRQCTAP